MPDIPFWIRVVALVVLMAVVAGVDLRFRRGRSKRWREYLFILIAGCLGGVFGLLTDMATSSISPEYFICAKGLPADGITAHAMLLGLQAGFSAGVIAGAICMFVGVRKNDSAQISPPGCLVLLWRPVLLALLLAAAAPFALGWFDPLGLEELFGGPLGPDKIANLLAVWRIHLGVYLGLGVGMVWVIVKMRRISAKRSAQST